MKLRSADLIKKYNIRLKKGLGQNLLLDPNINRKMAEVAGIERDDSVFEVGAGIGDLTRVLADRAGEVLTIEIDESFEPPLRERFESDARVKIFFGDVLNHTARELVERFLPKAKTLRMISNLPYYITSPILMHFLESEVDFISHTVMVQREVAERIVAAPGGKVYGILSIACQLYACPYIAHLVSPGCFRPKPKVESAIVHFPIRREPLLNSEEREVFFKIVGAAFRQRRKKIVNALTPLYGTLLPLKEDVRGLLEPSGIQPDVRAETVPIEAFIDFAKRIAQTCSPPN